MITHMTNRPPVGDLKDKGKDVQAMFASIAPRYDLLNRVLSAGIDKGWRSEAAIEALALNPKYILDVATGTGDFAIELKQRAPNAKVTGSDFVAEMLNIARQKVVDRQLDIFLEEGDALNLPYFDSSFDVITCAFGFRNFANYAGGLAEFHRVLAPGGRLVILEFPPPAQGFTGSLFRFYFENILPRIGGLISGNVGAYSYLPESVLAFPEPDRIGPFNACYRLSHSLPPAYFWHFRHLGRR